ncbi:MAG: YtxH domain-containing protein [Chloroflexi bacterium]|nr:YtxH domain-containing protein [Chloroflexota bacterium]
MNRDSGAGFFAGLIIGAVIGVAVGFLYAPQSGPETRRIAKEKAVAVKDAAAKAVGRVKEKMQSTMKPEAE